MLLTHDQLSGDCEPTGSPCLWQNLAVVFWPTVSWQTADSWPTVSRQVFWELFFTITGDFEKKFWLNETLSTHRRQIFLLQLFNIWLIFEIPMWSAISKRLLFCDPGLCWVIVCLIWRYLVDCRWLKQWKKYVGYDTWDQFGVGEELNNPGPIDNSSLFASEPIL